MNELAQTKGALCIIPLKKTEREKVPTLSYSLVGGGMDKKEICNETQFIIFSQPCQIANRTFSQFPVPDIGIPFFRHLSLKPWNYLTQALSFMSVSFQSSSPVALSSFIAVLTLTLLFHSSCQAPITPHLGFHRLPPSLQVTFDTCQINLLKASLFTVSKTPSEVLNFLPH